jgi:hypothetical protein
MATASRSGAGGGRRITLRHREDITRVNGGKEALHRWIEADLEQGWTVAARMITQKGRPAIAELRLFPTPTAASGTPRDLGTWNQDDATVPPRGLLHNILRAAPLGLMKEREHQIARQLGLIETVIDEPLPPIPVRPGRKGNPIEFDAYVAAIYVDELQRGSKGVHARTAARLGPTYKSTYVRKRISRCRERGLLTPTTTGKAGGELTGLAKAALRRGSPPST